MQPRSIVPSLILVPVVLVAACATTPPRVESRPEIPIDEAFLAAHLQWTFEAPQASCYAALVDVFGPTGVEREDEAKGEVVSTRPAFDVNATYTTTGTETSTSVIHNADGTTSTMKTTTPTTTTEHALLRQSTQYFFRVTGDTQRCEVSAFQWRAWNGEEEMLTLQPEGVQWAEQQPVRATARRPERAPRDPELKQPASPAAVGLSSSRRGWTRRGRRRPA